jgi:hypothetical protein
MSYNERPDGYKGVKYGVGAMAVLGIAFAVKMCSGTIGGLPPSTPLGAEQALLNDPQSGELFATIKRTYPQEFDGLKTEISNRGAEFQSNQDITNGARAFLLAAMKRHLGEIAQAPHAALSDYRKAEITSIRALQAGNVAACAGYFSTGTINLREGTPEMKGAMKGFQIKSWTTEAAGRDQPVKRDVSKPAAKDVATIVAGAVQSGSTTEDVNNLLNDMTMSDKARCGAGLALMEGIDALPDVKADNFTAFLVQIAAAKR